MAETLESMLQELGAEEALPAAGPGKEPGKGPRRPKPEKPKKEKRELTGSEKKKKKIIIIAVVAVLLLAGVTGGVMWYMNRPQLDDTTQYWFDKFAEDGTLEGKTPQEIQGMLDQVMEEGMVNVSMNTYVVFEDGTSEGSLGVENIAANRYYIRVILTNDADGSVLWESAGLKPGQYIDKITLNQDLPAGEYSCTAKEIITDPETLEDIGAAEVKVTILVKN